MRVFRRLAQGQAWRQAAPADEEKLKMLHALYADKSNSVADILATLNISRSTLYRHVKVGKRR